MRRSLEEHLKVFNELAKQDIREDEEIRDNELQKILEEFSKENNSTIDAQAEIFELQKEKQIIIQELKEGNQEKKDNQVEIIYEDDIFYIPKEDGTKIKITKGEILTDGDWGIDYYLNPDSIPRNFRKKYLTENAKRKLRKLLDRQIATEEISSAHDFHKMETYEKIKTRIENDNGRKKWGLIAETMVKNYLKKLSIDYNISFNVLDVDIYQDVEQKLDFIIARRPHFRGVKVNRFNTDKQNFDHQDVGNIDIQFTINQNQDVLDRKRKQIEKVKAREKGENNLYEDIVLIHIDIENIGKMFNKWIKQKKAGGPDKLLSQEMKKTIFFETLKGLMPQEELDKEWRKIL